METIASSAIRSILLAISPVVIVYFAHWMVAKRTCGNLELPVWITTN